MRSAEKAFRLLCTSIILALTACSQKSDYEFAKYYENLPFEMEKVQSPSIPDYSVCLTDFGGVGDGVTSNTEAFKSAMEHLNSKGGHHEQHPEHQQQLRADAVP